MNICRFIVVGFVLLAKKRPIEAYTCFEGNQQTDWTILYKLPRAARGDAASRAGTAYVQISSRTNEWRVGANDISRTVQGNSLFSILSQFYRDPQRNQKLAVMYNRHPPGTRVSPPYAGGAILGDEATGVIYLTHTVPSFPATHVYQWPTAAEANVADTIMCFSLPFAQLEELARPLRFGVSGIYLNQRPPAIALGTNMRDFLDAVPITSTPFRTRAEVTTAGIRTPPITMTVYGKFRRADQDIYSEFITQECMTEFVVWTSYSNTGQLLPPVCHPPLITYPVLAPRVTFNVQGQPPSTVTRRQDRSNFGLSVDGCPAMICLSGLARTTPALTQSGIAVCLEDAQIASNFRDFLNAAQSPCN